MLEYDRFTFCVNLTYIAKGFSYTCTAAAKSLQSCPTLCDPMDCSLPGSSIHGIVQARVLEWGVPYRCIYISCLSYYRIVHRAPWAIQWVFVVYLF